MPHSATQAIDPLALDRTLATCSVQWQRWRQQPLGTENATELFGRHDWATRQRTFDALRQLPQDDPLARPLLRWVYRLAEQRINHDAIQACTLERGIRSHDLDHAERHSATLIQMLLRGLIAKDSAAFWYESYNRHNGELVSAELALVVRRSEVAARLGLEDPRALSGVGIDAARVAENWLRQTADWAEADLRDDARFSRALMASAATEGWPARLSVGRLMQLLGDSTLLESVPLSDFSLPALLAPASVARGLQRLGAHYADALAPADQPFVIAHDPYGLARHERAQLFALLTLELPFLRRALGLGREAAEHAATALARAALHASRIDALRVLLFLAGLSHRDALEEVWATWARSCLPPTLARGRAFSVPKLRADSEQRLASWWLAARLREAFRHEHDEDWYRNPRCAEALRALTATPPATLTTDDVAAEGARIFAAWLAERLQR